MAEEQGYNLDVEKPVFQGLWGRTLQDFGWEGNLEELPSQDTWTTPVGRPLINGCAGL